MPDTDTNNDCMRMTWTPRKSKLVTETNPVINDISYIGYPGTLYQYSKWNVPVTLIDNIDSRVLGGDDFLQNPYWQKTTYINYPDPFFTNYWAWNCNPNAVIFGYNTTQHIAEPSTSTGIINKYGLTETWRSQNFYKVTTTNTITWDMPFHAQNQLYAGGGLRATATFPTVTLINRRGFVDGLKIYQYYAGSTYALGCYITWTVDTSNPKIDIWQDYNTGQSYPSLSNVNLTMPDTWYGFAHIGSGSSNSITSFDQAWGEVKYFDNQAFGGQGTPSYAGWHTPDYSDVGPLNPTGPIGTAVITRDGDTQNLIMGNASVQSIVNSQWTTNSANATDQASTIFDYTREINGVTYVQKRVANMTFAPLVADDPKTNLGSYPIGYVYVWRKNNDPDYTGTDINYRMYGDFPVWMSWSNPHMEFPVKARYEQLDENGNAVYKEVEQTYKKTLKEFNWDTNDD